MIRLDFCCFDSADYWVFQVGHCPLTNQKEENSQRLPELSMVWVMGCLKQVVSCVQWVGSYALLDSVDRITDVYGLSQVDTSKVC